MSSNPVGVSCSSWLNYSECDVNVWMQLLWFYLLCCNTLNSHPVLHEQLRRCNTLSSVECGVRCAARSNIRVVNVIPEFQFSGAVMSLQSPLKERTHLQANRLNTACSAELESLSPWQNVDSQLYTRRDYFAQVHEDFRVLAFVNWVSYWSMKLNEKVAELTKCSLILLFLFCFVKFCCVVEVKNTHVCHSSFIWNFQSTGVKEWWTMNQTTVRHMRGSHYFKTYTTLY